MPSLSRALRRWQAVRVAAVSLAIMTLVVLAAYVVAVVDSRATLGGVLAAASLLAFSVTGLLYAWRLGAGWPAD